MRKGEGDEVVIKTRVRMPPRTLSTENPIKTAMELKPGPSQVAQIWQRPTVQNKLIKISSRHFLQAALLTL
jgi:hypothetical protein